MDKKIGFIFPGQGSQKLGMLGELAPHFPVIDEVFTLASDTLGYDLWALTQQGPEEQLNQTEHTQPALLAADYALWRVWQERCPATPLCAAGHSLGEYAALVAAEVLSFQDGIRLVAKRGKYMQEAVPAGVGAMAAVIGLDDGQVRELCSEAHTGVVEPANFNSVGQVVVAGEKAAVEAVVANAKGAGAKMAVMLPVSVPSHCALMQPAADAFAAELNHVAFHAPVFPVIQNATVTSTDDTAQIKQLLVDQLTKPVRWVETVQAMAAQGAGLLVECGPGKVLAGLVKRVDRSLKVVNIDSPDALDAACQTAESME